MTEQHKTFADDVDVKSADRGEISAVIASFDVVDRDGDVSTRDTFEDGAETVISTFGHGSTVQSDLPVGKGTLRTTASECIFDGRFFLNTQAGRDTFTTVREVGARQEFSYGYTVLDAERGTFNGKNVQFLRRVEVHEVSPVLRGAGVGTRLLSAKTRRGVEPCTEHPHISHEDAVACSVALHQFLVFVKWDFEYRIKREIEKIAAEVQLREERERFQREMQEIRDRWAL